MPTLTVVDTCLAKLDFAVPQRRDPHCVDLVGTGDGDDPGLGNEGHRYLGPQSRSRSIGTLNHPDRPVVPVEGPGRPGLEPQGNWQPALPAGTVNRCSAVTVPQAEATGLRGSTPLAPLQGP